MPKKADNTKHFWMPFDVGEWMKDFALAKCQPATRGVWIDLLCAMHTDDRSGVISGTRDQLARLARCSAVEVSDAIADLQTTEAADVTERNGVVTLKNRRMWREYKSRNDARLRKQKERSGGACHAHVTGESKSHNNIPPQPPRKTRGSEREAEMDRKLREDLPPGDDALGGLREAS